jgi:phage terminase small subunit
MPRRSLKLASNVISLGAVPNGAPKHLATTEANLYRQIINQFQIDDAGSIALLSVACEAHMRMRLARERVDADGSVLLDRFKQAKAHPAIAIERDARSAFLKAMRALNLDVSGTTR